MRAPPHLCKVQTVQKTIITAFPPTKGILQRVKLVMQETVPPNWYITDNLPLVVQAGQRDHPNSMSQHLAPSPQNCITHQTMVCAKSLASIKLLVLEYISYSPTPSSCGFSRLPMSRGC